jgi:hypothetical protein
MPVDYHAGTHRPKALGGTDPIDFPAASSSAWLEDLLANGTGLNVANDNWEPVVTGTGANQRWLNEFLSDPAGDWGRNFATGAISNAGGGLAYNYAAWGFVIFTGVSNGDTIGAGIQFTGAEDFYNTTTVVDGVAVCEVSAERTPLTSDARLLCYQASGGVAELLAARLHVRRFEVFEDVYASDSFS